MSQNKKSFSDKFLNSVYEGIHAMNSGQKLTRRKIKVLPAPSITCEKIIKIRTSLGVSQGVFAMMMNVACQTVQAWEQGRNKPKGETLRFFQIIEKNPQILLALITDPQTQSHRHHRS